MQYVERAFYKFCSFIEILEIAWNHVDSYISIESTYMYIV